MRVRRTLFLLGQSIIEPRGGFSCQLTFSPIYTRPHSSSSTSSTQNLPSCCQESNTNNRKIHVVPFLICINQYFLLMTPLLCRGGGGIIDSKVAKLNHDVSRCGGKIVAAQRFSISLSSCSHLFVMVSFGV